jgi:hypothetical protein
MKTWDQLNREQSVRPDALYEKPMAGPVASFTNALKGTTFAAGAGALNLAGTIAGRPLTYGYDALTGSNTNEVLNDSLAVLQDYRDRGAHQAYYAGRSNALNDRFRADAQNVSDTFGPTSDAARTYNAAATSADVLPNLIPMGGSATAAARMVSGAPTLASRLAAGTMAGTSVGQWFGEQIDGLGLTAPSTGDWTHATVSATNPTNPTVTVPRIGNTSETYNLRDLSPEQLQLVSDQPQNAQAVESVSNQIVNKPEMVADTANVLEPADRIAVTGTDAQAKKQVVDQVAASHPDFAAATEQLGVAQTDADRETVIKNLAKSMSARLSGDDLAAANAIANGDFKSPQAQRFMQEKMGPAGDKFRAEYAQRQLADSPELANDPGFFGQVQGMASQAWEGMGPMGQLAFTFGAPMALIGLLGGGGLMSLLGGLGIGALGVGAAGMGVFGDQARAGVGRMMGDAANFFGMIPDEARTMDSFSESAVAATKKRIIDAMRAAKPGEGANVGQSMIDAERAKFNPLRDLYESNPAAAHTYLMGLRGAGAPKTPDEAEALYQKLLSRYNETGADNYLYEQAMPMAKAEAQKQLPWWSRLLQAVAPDAVNKRIEAETEKHLGFKPPPQPAPKKASLNAMDQKELADLDARQVEGVPYRIEDARRHHQLRLRQQANAGAQPRTAPLVKRVTIVMCMKSARCWAGYEPVPGKKPYSNDSCRPIARRTPKKNKKGTPAAKK